MVDNKAPWPGAKRAAGEGPCTNCGHSDPHYVAAGQDICTHEKDGVKDCDCECYSTKDAPLIDPERVRRSLLRPPVAKRMLLPFRPPEDTGYDGLGYRRVYTAEPQVIFKPKGLMLWGELDDAEVTHVKIGRDYQLVATWGPIPARWFSMAKSYEEVMKAFEEGKDPPGWGEFNVIQLGMHVEVLIDSKKKLGPTQILMWGLGIQ